MSSSANFAKVAGIAAAVAAAALAAHYLLKTEKEETAPVPKSGMLENQVFLQDTSPGGTGASAVEMVSSVGTCKEQQFVDDLVVSELQKLCCEVYEAYPYDNFSRQYERDIVKPDDDSSVRGGNCVFLSRLFYFSKVTKNAKLAAADCKFIISKKRVRDNGGPNHIIIVYGGEIVIELAGSDAFVLRINGFSPGAYEAKSCPDDQNIINVIQKSNSRTITTFHLDDIYTPSIRLEGACTSQAAVQMREVIRVNRRVFYSTRFKTGQASVTLSVTVETTDDADCYKLGYRLGSIKNQKYKETKEIVCPFSSVKEFEEVLLNKLGRVHLGFIKMNFVTESLEQWLAHPRHKIDRMNL